MISALTFPNTAEPKGQRAPGLEELLRAHGQTDGWTATSRALPMLIRLCHVSMGKQFLFKSQMSPARSPPTRAGAEKPPKCCSCSPGWETQRSQRPPFRTTTPENLFSHQFYGQQRPDGRRRQPHGPGGGLDAHQNVPKQTPTPGPPGPLLQPLHGHITTGLSPPLMSNIHQFLQAHLTPFLGLIRHQETRWPMLMPATHGSAPAADEANDEGLNIAFPPGKLLWDLFGT